MNGDDASAELRCSTRLWPEYVLLCAFTAPVTSVVLVESFATAPIVGVIFVLPCAGLFWWTLLRVFILRVVVADDVLTLRSALGSRRVAVADVRDIRGAGPVQSTLWAEIRTAKGDFWVFQSMANFDLLVQTIVKKNPAVAVRGRMR
jgi:Bacterial PH domain